MQATELFRLWQELLLPCADAFTYPGFQRFSEWLTGLVLNDTVGGRQGLAEKTNIRALPELCRVPLLGVVPHGKHGLPAAIRSICNHLFS